MRWSFKVGSVFSIPIRIHITFFLLLAFVAIIGKTPTEGLYGVLFVLLVFVCVILHELSHSLVAMRFGHVVRNITLLPIGGMAQMDEIPDDPKQEIFISLAGPLMSVAISGVLFGVLAFLHIPIETIKSESFFEGNLLLNLFWINIFLAGFNIIPAFPMDGGRVLRGILGMFIDHMRATRIAVFIGQVFAIFLFFLGIFSNLWLVLIAVFIYLGAEGEERMWAIRHALSDARVKEVMLTDFRTLSPSDLLSTAKEAFLHTSQGNFPVKYGDTLIGILRRDLIVRGISEGRDNERVTEFIDRDFLSTTERQKLVTLYKEMTERGVEMVPVMREKSLVGIITMEQIGRYHMLSAARGAK